ncbi:metacaspase casa [Armillaria nabsnona]|nr:metacaspase casa [Armillaria nabsnona]
MSLPSTVSLDSQIYIRERGARLLSPHDYADSPMSVAYQHHDHSGSGYLCDSSCSELPPDTQVSNCIMRTPTVGAVNNRLRLQFAHSDYIRHSDSSGGKRALCIGINYRDKSNELRGCIKDARDMRDFLMRNGYKDEDIKMLTDEIDNTPTKENILNALSGIVKGARSDDSLFIHYSGHGSQTVDTNGDEVDRKDEVIECIGSSFISDDEIHEILKSLPAGCRLTTLFDSCHSGTVLDLPYVYDCEGQRERAVTALVLDNISADVICWSAAKDNQEGADTPQGGVMTQAFIEAFEKNPNQSYKQLLHSMRSASILPTAGT